MDELLKTVDDYKTEAMFWKDFADHLSNELLEEKKKNDALKQALKDVAKVLISYEDEDAYQMRHARKD